ncbi:tRNA uridine-5-carboxymethylaminomethyl(34) synthesis GTPase MnmE [bacterium]|nr:tRNA uridine-5-carboxymethylaminomethyl(34) synthesis GTPase MnmE [bacterium]
MIDSVEDTIAAVATPEGNSALGVVRVTGPRAIDIAGRATDNPHRFCSFNAREANLVRLVDEQGHVLDQAVALLWRAPASYTGEDLVEFSCHGGRAVLRSVYDRLVDLGARPAGPGEFTQRAFLNGKMSLDEAEAVAALIEARTTTAVRAAARMMQGGMRARVEELQQRLLDLLARVELSLDFVEEELELETAEVTINRTRSLHDDLTQLRQQFKAGRLLREGARIVIAGAPNAGKSTLLNRLAGHERALVSETPGTTRDYLDVVLDWNGLPVHLYDTAGLRESADMIERAGTDRTNALMKEADLVIWLVAPPEPSLPPSSLSAGPPLLRVVNKYDLSPGQELADRLEDVDLAISATTGEGVESLQHLVSDRLLEGYNPDSVILWESRHDRLLSDTSAALERAITVLETGSALELIAVELRTALDTLGQITGRSHSEELLHHIFANFCIGK